MRVALVGPTHPLKGGVAQHTTALAERLKAAGHEVEIVSWLRQYPKRLYPGKQTVDVPEYPPFEPTRRPLSWDRPDAWVRVGRQLRTFDVVVFAHITPVQVLPYRLMLAALRRGRARTVVICHNVLPHERGRFDEWLVVRLLQSADRVLVHSETEAHLARTLTETPVVVAPIAPFLPPTFEQRHPLPGEHRRLIFFGLVRPYRGLDVALHALARGPSDIRLRVAGEFWGGPGPIEQLALELGIAGRLEVHSAAGPEVPKLFTDVDALILPYRTATRSQGVWTGFEFGVPVIATQAGHLADDIRDGVDGPVAEPDNVDSFASVIERFYQPGVPELMRSNVKPVDPAPYWNTYLTALLPGVGHSPEGVGMQKAAAPGGAVIHAAKVAAEQVLWIRVRVQRLWLRRRGRVVRLPSPVPATDVLRRREENERAITECCELRLPLHHDRPKNWDALGAVSTVVNRPGTDVRVLDAGVARYSSVLPWLRLLGVANLSATTWSTPRRSSTGRYASSPPTSRPRPTAADGLTRSPA